ncbi:MAG TPA: polysaccharide biosynthesis C-terminal domain-containing protein [Vicingus sp.]|nr:hypothetical protein [Flavobacteriales bacterium]HRN41206.1 polysaccharide biosynthesis C-terminal domain-containing protein [Vicingus sp.]HRP59120.1 polysaccharide biosynthesis C-terminal domain-containing protein [Vicingus sp.]
MGIVIKKSITTSIISYIGILLGVISVLWLQTAIITELQIGILSYIVDVTILLLPLILFGTSGIPVRFLHLFKENKNRNQFITSLFIIPAISIFLFLLLFLIFKQEIFLLLGKNTSQYSDYLIFIFPLLFCYSYQYLIEAILSTESLIVFSSFLKNIQRRLVLILLLVLYHFKIISFYQLVQWYVFSHLIETIALYFFFTNHFQFKFSNPLPILKHPNLKEFISYGLYLIIGVSGLVMVGKIDTVMINSLTNNFELLGVYAIAFFIGSVIEIPKRIVHQLVFPIMSKLVAEDNKEELEKLYKQSGINLSILGVFLFLIIWFNIDELFLLIPNGEKYVAGKWVVFFIGLSKVIDVGFGTTDLVIYSTKYYKMNIFLAPILILLTIITNYLFIPKFGIIGAAIATTITVLLYSTLKIILVNSMLKLNQFNSNYISILGITIFITIIFYFKPIFFSNNFLEIIANSTIISIIFIGGILTFKTSNEINDFVKNNLKKYLKTN